MANNLLAMARMLVQSNQSRLPNAPWAGPAIQAIISGDAQAGEQIADNLCQSFGMSREQVLQQAKQMFRI